MAFSRLYPCVRMQTVFTTQRTQTKTFNSRAAALRSIQIGIQEIIIVTLGIQKLTATRKMNSGIYKIKIF